MSRAQVLSLAMVAILALIIGYLALRNRQAPVLPADEEHARVAHEASCMGECHGPEGVFPQDTNHPLGDDCMRCHGRP